MEPHHSALMPINQTIGIFLVPKKENASGMKNIYLTWRYMSQVANLDEEVREAVPILLKDGSNILGRGIENYSCNFIFCLCCVRWNHWDRGQTGQPATSRCSIKRKNWLCCHPNSKFCAFVSFF